MFSCSGQRTRHRRERESVIQESKLVNFRVYIYIYI